MRLDVKDMTVDMKHVQTAEIHLTVYKNQLNEIGDLKPPYTVEITHKRKKRSLSANAYCWVLCEKIAQKVGNISKEEVYRRAIRDVGVWDIYQNTPAAVARMERTWSRQGVGWMTERLESQDGVANIILYYGSSTYSVEEMNRLLDNLIQDAEALEIDTATPRERSLMMEAWKHGAE